MQEADAIVAQYRMGSVDADRLEDELSAAWEAALDDSDARMAMASILGVDADQLSSIAMPPFGLRPSGAGLDSSTVIINVVLWIGTDVVLGSVRDRLKENFEQRLRLVWKQIEPRLRSRFDRRDALGAPHDREGVDV